jgi:integrase/recombinase XerD
MSLNDHIGSFLEMMSAERGSSRNTIESYKRDLDQFARFDPGSNIEDIKSEHIADFISAISKNYSKSSICRKISALKQFFGFLKSEGLISHDPTHLLEQPRKDRLLPDFLTQGEIGALIAEAEKDNDPKGYRMVAFISILSGSGLRVSEIISLKKNNIQTTVVNGAKHNYLLIRGKGDKERIAPLSDETYHAIIRYLGVWESFLTGSQKLKDRTFIGNSWLFPSKGQSGHITRQQVANLLKSYALRAGIDSEKISPHVLRHSFATNILQKGLDLRVLQEILGHSDISTTQIYTQTNPVRMKNFVEKHHPLAKNTNT